MTKSERVLAAVAAYKAESKPSIRRISAIYGIHHQTLANHLAGRAKTVTDYAATQQRLTPAEEVVITETIQLAYQQGFPLTIASIREIASEILQERGSTELIGVNWHLYFLKRRPELRSAFSRPIDKQRILSEDPDTFIDWFHLFQETRAKYGIPDSDIYNMDESGCAISVEQASKIVVPANEKETFAKQDGKRQWATLIECISATGDKAPLFAILAGKTHLADNWANVKAANACLAISDNGWTNNALSFEWLKYFDA